MGDFNEKKETEKGTNFHRPFWMDLDKITSLHLYPLEIRNTLLADFNNNFKDSPKESRIDIKEIRQR